MTESILNHKKLLIVDDESDVLEVIEEEILQSCPDAKIDKASNFETAAELLKSQDYDLVILDIMGVQGFDLLEIAVDRGFKVAIVTAHDLNTEALKKAHDMGARAYIPKDKIGALVPFLEDIWLSGYMEGWKGLMSKLEKFFDTTFEPDWKKKAGIQYW
jgi:DNA-binding NtrC family response regulator